MGLSKATYTARRAAGLCTQCGEDASGKSTCPLCKEKDKASRRERIARRKAAGQCQTSGCPHDAMPDKTVCAACAAKASKNTMARYYANKASGVCAYCGNESDGENSCDDCKARVAAAGYSAAWYKARKAAGECVNCALPHDGPTLVCEACKPGIAEVAEARRQRLKAAAFEAYGGPVCAICDDDKAETLQIDHINGGGTKHLTDIGLGNIYLWLQQNNYPSGFRVLCPTCNKREYANKPK